MSPWLQGPILDPDRDWRSPHTRQHLLGCLIACLLLSWILPPLVAAAIVLALGLGLELGQWDIARGTPQLHEGGDPARPFLPGFGFGLMDLAADLAGTLIALALRGLLGLAGG